MKEQEPSLNSLSNTTSSAKSFTKDINIIARFYTQYKSNSFDYHIEDEEIKKHIPNDDKELTIENLKHNKLHKTGLHEYKSIALKYKDKLSSSIIIDIKKSRDLKKQIKSEISPYIEDEPENKKPPFTIGKRIEVTILIILCLIIAFSETIMMTGFLMKIEVDYMNKAINYLSDDLNIDNAKVLYFLGGAIIPLSSVIATFTYSNVKYKKGFSNSIRMKRFSFHLFSIILSTIIFNSIYSLYNNRKPAFGVPPTLFETILSTIGGTASFLTLMLCSVLALSIGTSLILWILKSHSPMSLRNNPAYIDICKELSDIEEIYSESLRQLANMESIEERYNALSQTILSEYQSKHSKLLKAYTEREELKESILNEKF
ncbi:hypothetical protein [Oceanospirillum beijerinckii]|uniref:hypothetical protein n=1 Tax=Oceanospirillum beijerinckii TaxID=64976 RepID=UPI00040703A1|nr:hypothetical protein [Oceanospirillum beijerinckii]